MAFGAEKLMHDFPNWTRNHFHWEVAMSWQPSLFIFICVSSFHNSSHSYQPKVKRLLTLMLIKVFVTVIDLMALKTGHISCKILDIYQLLDHCTNKHFIRGRFKGHTCLRFVVSSQYYFNGVLCSLCTLAWIRFYTSPSSDHIGWVSFQLQYLLNFLC